MCFFAIFENLFDWLFTQIYLVYWYIWYSFDYYLVLTNFTSCLFIYFKIENQFSFITDINGYFEIPNPTPRLFWPQFIKFNWDIARLFDPAVY